MVSGFLQKHINNSIVKYTIVMDRGDNKRKVNIGLTLFSLNLFLIYFVKPKCRMARMEKNK